MSTRSTELRRANRKVLAWSMALAAVAHVAVFTLLPAFRTEPLSGSTRGAEPPEDPGGTSDVQPVLAHLVFGPPTLSAPDGTVWTEPAERVLKTGRLFRLSRQCSALIGQDEVPLSGRVRLHVLESGRVEVVGLVKGTGNACADHLLTTAAEDLWYRWLPTPRFPAPVELVQPITVADLR